MATIQLDDSEFLRPFITPLCLICDRAEDIDNPLKCTAFPNGIPEAILSGEFIHTSSFPGDDSLLFKPFDAEKT